MQREVITAHRLVKVVALVTIRPSLSQVSTRKYGRITVESHSAQDTTTWEAIKRSLDSPNTTAFGSCVGTGKLCLIPYVKME